MTAHNEGDDGVVIRRLGARTGPERHTDGRRRPRSTSPSNQVTEWPGWVQDPLPGLADVPAWQERGERLDWLTWWNGLVSQTLQGRT